MEQERVHETITPIVTWRKNVSTDAADIVNLMTSEHTDQFGDVNVSLLIERSQFSISQVNANGNIVSHVSLFAHPNIPVVPPWGWVNWAKRLYGLGQLTSGNSLFIHLITWNIRYSSEFLKPLLDVIFLNCSYLENILIVLPPGITMSEIFETYFARFLPRKLENLRDVQTIYLCTRKNHFPKLTIRMALDEDHDDLTSLNKAKNVKLGSLYGNYYFSDIISHTPENRKLFTAERNGIVVGVMSLNTNIDLNQLDQAFELKTFYGLHKPGIEDKFVLKQLKVVNSLQKTVDNYCDRERFPAIYEKKSSNAEIQYEEKYETDHAIISPHDAVSCSDECNRSKLMESLRQEPILPLQTKIIWHNPLELNLPENSPSMTEKEFGITSGTIKLHKQAIDHPSYYGKGNAFCIELLALHDGYDEREFKDLLLAPFEVFPDRDYCLISLPFTHTTFPFINDFVTLVQKYQQKFPHDVFLLHRNAALSSVTVRYYDPLDYDGVITLLQTMDFHKEIEIFLYTTKPFNSISYMTFIFESEGAIVGLAVIREEEDINTLHLHYKVDIFNKVYLIDPEEHGEIIHFILSPIFQRHSKFIIREILRLTGMACIYYRLYSSCMEGRQKQLNIMNALGEMMPVQPRRYITSLSEDTKEYRERKEEYHCFALYLMNSRLTNQLSIYINTRIIIVGASTTALSLLESMIFRSTREFLTLQNITLVSPFGLPCRASTDNIASMFVMDGEYYSSDYLDKLSLCSWVNIVFGNMTVVDRKNKKITVNDHGEMDYDYLIILTGEQFLDELQILSEKFQHNFQRKSQVNCLKNSFCINSYEEGCLLLKYLRNNFCKSSPRKIIVYGYSLEAYIAIEALRRSQYPGESIIFVENIPFDGEIMTCFNNNEVYHGVINAIRKERIEILRGYYIESWIVNHDKNEVTSIKFSNRNLYKEFECLVLINCGKKSSNKITYSAITHSLLAYNNGLVIQQDFSTNDPYIFAAGTHTKYAKQLHAEEFEHHFYNSREIGKKMCKELRYIWNPNYKRRMEVNEFQLLGYKKPLVTACKLPGGRNYLHVCKPGVQMPLDEAMRNSNYGTALVTGDCFSEYGAYFRIHLNSKNVIEAITCYSSEDIEIGKIIKLYGKHEKSLNYLLKRYKLRQITNFQEYFSQLWTNTISYDGFSKIYTRLMKSFENTCESDDITAKEIRQALWKIKNNEETEENKNFLRNKIKTFLPKKKIESAMLEWMQENRLFLPPFAHSNDTRVNLTGHKSSQFYRLQ